MQTNCPHLACSFVVTANEGTVVKRNLSNLVATSNHQ
jgi:hypothetical protein